MLTLLTALAATLLAMNVGASAPRPSHASNPPQPIAPVIVLVHGRGEHSDSAQFRRDALGALRDGATAAGLGTAMGDDLRVVWYADLLGERGVNGTDSERRECERGNEAAPLGMLTVFATSLLDLAGDDSADNGAGDSTAHGVRDRRALRGMLGDLRFLASPSARCVAELRLARTLRDAGRDGRPVILVAHSMGGLISWRHLQSRTARGVPAIQRYVTVGSPVGSPTIRALLFGERGEEAIALPRGVTRWVNVVDPADPFAVPLHDPLEPPAPEVARVVQDLTLPESAGERYDAHALLRYLSHPQTARAILQR